MHVLVLEARQAHTYGAILTRNPPAFPPCSTAMNGPGGAVVRWFIPEDQTSKVCTLVVGEAFIPGLIDWFFSSFKSLNSSTSFGNLCCPPGSHEL